MLGRFVLALATGLTLVQAPISAAPPGCCPAPESHQSWLLDGCCAPTACCAISAADAPQPATLASATNQIAASPMIVSLVTPISFPASPRELRFAHTSPVAHAPPPLVLLCTRLI